MTMHVSEAVDWTIFSSLTTEPVQYYSVLNQKSEFSELVKEYDSQVFKYGCSHYCCIIPKSSDQTNQKQLFIFFMDEVLDSTFIGFWIHVDEDSFLLETNRLILFLKKSNRAVYYSMEKKYIYVKCQRNIAWELFYGLYHVYLKRYLLTVIGTKFFYSFFYLYFIQKEKLLLKLLFKGSKVVNISKKSIFYKIHKKRKLSVTDILRTCQYMPQSKKYTFSCITYKEPRVILRNSQKYMKNTSQCYMKPFNNNVYKHPKSYVHFKSMKGIQCISNSHIYSEHPILTNKCDKDNDKFEISRKRKFNELEGYDHNIQSTFPLNDCDYNKYALPGEKFLPGKWDTFCDIKSYDIKNYSEIPQLKKIVPLLLKNQPKLHISEPLYKKSTNVFQSNLSKKRKNSKETHLVLKHIYGDEKSKINEFSTYANSQHTKIDNRNSSVNSCHFLANSIIAEKEISGSDPQLKNSRNNSEYIHSDEMFSTASGKTMFIPIPSVLAAQKIMQDILCEKEIDVPESKNCGYIFPLNEMPNSTPVTLGGEQKAGIGSSMCLNKPINIFAEFNKFSTNVDKTGDKPENFFTADGKSIILSNVAISAAQKMLQDVMDDDNRQKLEDESKLNIYKNINISEAAALELPVCSPSNLDASEDVDMDGTLVEKFFEDTHFDEQDFATNECAAVGNKNVDIELRQSKKVFTNKPKKSLGGRRSMRYSDKL